MGLVDFILAAYYRRTSTHDELWILYPEDYPAESKGGLALALRIRNDEKTSCLYMIRRLLRYYDSFYSHGGFIQSGLVSEDEFDKLLSTHNDEYRANREKSMQNETSIIKTARELNLNPYPTGEQEGSWIAHCPKTNHGL